MSIIEIVVTLRELVLLMKFKAIPLTAHGGPWGCETSRLPHFLESRLTDSRADVSLTLLPLFTPRKIPGTHFCQRLSRPQGHSAAGRIRSIEKSSDLIENRNRDLPACSIMPQPTTLPHVMKFKNYELLDFCLKRESFQGNMSQVLSIVLFILEIR
jgi:hypothetical protein